MITLRCVKFTLVFFITVLFFSPLLTFSALADEDVTRPVCATPLEVGAQGRKLFERALLDPTPEVIPLFYLPRDECGYVDWAEAMRLGILAPRDSIDEKYSLVKALRSPGDIIIQVQSSKVADVLFPHDTHNEVLECKSCHPAIFRKEAGKTGISMAGIWEGEYCGRCHGKVSFPLSNCSRCHSSSGEVFTNK